MDFIITDSFNHKYYAVKSSIGDIKIYSNQKPTITYLRLNIKINQKSGNRKRRSINENFEIEGKPPEYLKYFDDGSIGYLFSASNFILKINQNSIAEPGSKIYSELMKEIRLDFIEPIKAGKLLVYRENEWWRVRALNKFDIQMQDHRKFTSFITGQEIEGGKVLFLLYTNKNFSDESLVFRVVTSNGLKIIKDRLL